MLDKAKLQEAAKAAFAEKIKKEVTWLAKDCWVTNLKSTTSKLNHLLESANEMGAAKVTLLTEAELTELVKDLTPLRNLEMVAEACEHIINVLTAAHGVDPEIFKQPAAPEK